VLDLDDSGKKIGEKLFTLLAPNQKKELAQFAILWRLEKALIP
jgi:hypothetical protein